MKWRRDRLIKRLTIRTAYLSSLFRQANYLNYSQNLRRIEYVLFIRIIRYLIKKKNLSAFNKIRKIGFRAKILPSVTNTIPPPLAAAPHAMPFLSPFSYWVNFCTFKDAISHLFNSRAYIQKQKQKPLEHKKQSPSTLYFDKSLYVPTCRQWYVTKLKKYYKAFKNLKFMTF